MKITALRASFENSWKKIKIFLPFIWPKSFQLKIYFLLTLVILCVSAVINVYTPIYSKKIVDSLIPEGNENSEFRWDFICIYCFLKYLRSINDLKEIFWSRIDHNVNKEIEISVFAHIQNLSIRWHLNRKTGEVIQIMGNSRHCISYLLNLSVLSMIPAIVDNIFIMGVFTYLFDLWFIIMLCLCMIVYCVFIVMGREKISELRMQEISAIHKVKDKSMDSLINFETVKYFGNEKYEVESFREAVEMLYDGELTLMKQDFFLRAVENFIIDLSLMVGTLMCVYKIVKTKGLTVGDYVMFCDYFSQIYSSVYLFAYVYKTIKGYLVEIENLYDLLTEKPEVKDAPDAKFLEVTGGAIEFKNVFFEYLDNQPILKNVSFLVPPGQTVAIVGPSGSGKSTIVRLIFRFYDVVSGSILIDGQNIKDVKQESLRKSIGVVPQDTVLFNDTIKYNIGYGNLKAADDEIVVSAKGADMHEAILNFKEGYETEVGERGLRLSGGEKQRVAIARTLLKAPRIVLLDEATSALDTQTERNIQESLSSMCSNRTTLIIAHRLSTIIHADQILVLKEGIIVERGRHDELLAEEGLYASMWKLQLESNISE